MTAPDVEPLVSIIMPAYDVEAYVERAVACVLHQTYRDFELIVVDDGSHDGTPAILDRLARLDPRIIVVHKQNGGAPAARNDGIAMARGRYAWFVDADDLIREDMLDRMVTLAEESDLELVVTGFTIETHVGGETLTEVKSCPDVTYVSQYDFRSHAYRLFDENLLYTPWNKLFLTDRLRRLGIRFRDTFWDDFPFVLDYIRDVERVGNVSAPLYRFQRQREDSETTRWREGITKKRIEEDEWMRDLYAHWQICDKDSLEMLSRRHAERIVGCIESICDPSSPLTASDKIREIRDIVDDARVHEAAEDAVPHSAMMRLMLAPLRWRSVPLCYAEGHFVAAVKTSMPMLFARLKASR